MDLCLFSFPYFTENRFSKSNYKFKKRLNLASSFNINLTTVGDNVYVSHFSTVLQFFTLVFSACLDSIRSTFAANVRVQFQTPCPLKHSNHIWRRFPSLVRFLPIFGDECKPVLVCWGNPPLFWKFEALAKAFHGIIPSNDSNVFSCKKFLSLSSKIPET